MAILGGILYFVQAWDFAHNLLSIMDEGLYLYKGFLFASGRYHPYQDYGPWTNHMPLSFIIPGYVQVWFGLGIRTGRYYALILGLLALVGVWILARRIAGRWAAAAVIWLIAINPSRIKVLSWAAAQILISFLLIWLLVLIIGERRKLWEIIIGAILAGLIVLTRINLSPVLPIVLLYIFWQHGRKMGFIATALSGLVVLTGLVIYWPDILKFLSGWMPSILLDLFQYVQPTFGGTLVPVEDFSILAKLQSLFLGFRFHFAAISGLILTCLALPNLRRERNHKDFKSIILIIGLFSVLLVTHLIASFVLNYCSFCFAGYIAYFDTLGILLIVITFPYWKGKGGAFRDILLIIVVLILAAGIGYAAFEDVGEVLLNIQFPRLLSFLRSRQLPIGHVSLGTILEAKFNLDYPSARRIVPALSGLGLGIGIILLAYILNRTQKLKDYARRGSFGFNALLVFIAIGYILTPTQLLGGGDDAFVCSQDVVANYEYVGAVLNQQIPAESTVFWQAYSPIPLLYIPQVNIYPAQLNNLSTLRLGGETESLARYGLWNEVLAREWITVSDYVMIEEGEYFWPDDLVDTSDFAEIGEAIPLNPCNINTNLHILRRSP